MQNLSTDSLMQEVLAETMLADSKAFTLTKKLGAVEIRRSENGEPLPDTDPSARLSVEMNAAAVRLLTDRIPSLKITYPQTKLSEKAVTVNGQTVIYTVMRTDAVIAVPEDFVQIHSGTAFRKLIREEWSEQFSDLTARIAERLRKHELRTQRLFGKEDTAAAAVSFRVTEETAESDIWCIPLRKCGLYPLQWDGEICGMAVMLAEALKAPLAEASGEILEITPRRDSENKQCTVTVYYSCTEPAALQQDAQNAETPAEEPESAAEDAPEHSETEENQD